MPAVNDAATVPPLADSVGNRLFGQGRADEAARDSSPGALSSPPPSQAAELRALRIEVDQLRSRLAEEAAYRTELEAALTVLTRSVDRVQVEEIRSDAFEKFFNAEDPQHAADRDFLLQ